MFGFRFKAGKHKRPISFVNMDIQENVDNENLAFSNIGICSEDPRSNLDMDADENLLESENPILSSCNDGILLDNISSEDPKLYLNINAEENRLESENENLDSCKNDILLDSVCPEDQRLQMEMDATENLLEGESDNLNSCNDGILLDSMCSDDPQPSLNTNAEENLLKGENENLGSCNNDILSTSICSANPGPHLDTDCLENHLQSEIEKLDSCNNGILLDNICPENTRPHLDTDVNAEGSKKWLRSSGKHSTPSKGLRSVKKNLRCQECDFSTRDSKCLYVHILGHTDDRPFKCRYCPYVSRTESILRIHTKSHDSDAPLYIIEPLTVEPPAEEPPDAIKSKLRKRKVVEPEGQKGNVKDSSASPALEKPMPNTAKIEAPVSKKFRCDHAGCTYSTDAPISFKNHLSVHSNEVTFKCRICLKSFRKPSHRLRHEKLHVKKITQLCEHDLGIDCTKCNKVVFRCLWCPFTCDRESQLIIHCRSPHRFKSSRGSTAATPHPVPDIHIKQDDYPETGEQNDHEKLQDVEFIFTNNYVMFPNKTEDPVTDDVLFVHPSSVGSEGNFVLEVTPSDTVNGASEVSSFTTVTTTTCSVMPEPAKTVKKRVLSNGANSKKFKCNQLGCSFSSACSKKMILHRLLHSMSKGKKPFKCSLCPKSFVKAEGLKAHERSHVHGFPHRCKKCDFATQYKSSLTKHIFNKHKDRAA